MQSITQQHEFGCGIACVSFIAGRPYDDVARLLGAEQAATRGFWCKDLIAALRTYGLTYQYRYIQSNVGELPDGSIIFLKRSTLYPAGHYLAKRDGQWMDSWINFASNKRIAQARSGFRRQLPYAPSYVILPA